MQRTMSLDMVSANKVKAMERARRKKDENNPHLAKGGEDSDAPYRSEID